MSGKKFDTSVQVVRKMPGWFSWRHRTNEAHTTAREAYLTAHGPAARKRRALERLSRKVA